MTRLPDPLRGPDFGSFAEAEVGWLVTDLSEVELEAPTEEREVRAQRGGHYSESLPIEYVPPPEYTALFDRLLATTSEPLAYWIAVVADRLLADRGDQLVLASLARAGTPIGVLVRDWMQWSHGVSPEHYALSIIRDKGIDQRALDYLQTHHGADRVVFLDGWTGKGAITRELHASLRRRRDEGGTRFNPDLAVVADPGSCTPVYGTREDLMVASACLNSTTCGLVSRTVHAAELIGPGEYHGAKFYRHLAAADRTQDFLIAVREQFPAVAERVRNTPAAQATEPTWSGWEAVVDLARRYGVADVNLVKPGIGETTRVLLRRVPWKVAVRDPAAPEVAHILYLAQERGVDVVVEPDLPFHCAGVIRDLTPAS